MKYKIKRTSQNIDKKDIERYENIGFNIKKIKKENGEVSYYTESEDYVVLNFKSFKSFQDFIKKFSSDYCNIIISEGKIILNDYYLNGRVSK